MSVARAWRLAVGPASPPTLGLTKTPHPMPNLHARRFSELEDQLKQVEQSKHFESDLNGRPREYVDDQLLLNWRVKARSLLVNACGESSQHFKAFAEAEQTSMYTTNLHTLIRVRAVFLAAREDYEGGYLSSVRNLVHAEVFENELEQASELLAAGFIAPAAVVAGVVLETALRNLCASHNLAPGSLDRMNADLAKAGAYNGLVQKRITALAAVRNSAAHGKTSEYSAADVKAMLPEVERLIGQFLS